MSKYAIKEYLSEVEKLIHFGGTKKETAIRNPFYSLLNEYAKAKGLMLVPEVTIKAANSNKNVTPDGTLKDVLRQDWGYWESKDEADDINEEIKKKFEKGYPKDNILFEDSNTAILIQNGVQVKKVSIKDVDALDELLTAFVNFERPEVRNFRKAIELFKQDVPKVTDALRKTIMEAETNNPKFLKASKQFLKLCHESINPDITLDDVREMIIQHILTEDVFNTIFDEIQFHRENNIAKELNEVVATFFTGQTRKSVLGGIQHYYQAINSSAAGIADHHEKQKFLKIIYETFYKSYNPKAADKLGVVYTPSEIVQFMIKSTDYLLHKHFNRYLEDKDVEILDPATGTGTFICDIIDYLPKDKLEYKYKNELHANEVAILPYYISNLNIEYTYAQKMGKYAEFEHLCFVDTLDNMGFARIGKQQDLFAPFTEENTKRIKNQNKRKIAVVIGNPPYNAMQQNANDQNKNRKYDLIDRRVKDTFVKLGTAQLQNQLYDMYVRFYRWAMDRLNDNGIIAFITNRSFIDSRTFDGFRKIIQTDFDTAYIIDTKSDVRTNPKIAGTTHNVFGIQTGVAIMFLIKYSKREKNAQCNIHYMSLEDDWRKEQKLQFLNYAPFRDIEFEHIQPDKNNNWLNIANNDFEKLLPLIDKGVKAGKSNKSIFNKFSRGLTTSRDEWLYDFSENQLQKKVKLFCEIYMKDKSNWELSNKQIPLTNFVNRSIKWTEELESYLKKGTSLTYNSNRIVSSVYRPFVKMYHYFDRIIVHRPYLNESFFGIGKTLENKTICISGLSSSKGFQCYGSDNVTGLDLLEKTQCIPLYFYDGVKRSDNITDWGLEQFTNKFGTKGVTKETIFNYVYAVLHNPAYRKKYELNLKREFPRIPLYKDFHQWSKWGKELMDLHIGYQNVKPFKLVEKTTGTKAEPKAKLKADKEKGIIYLDENTSLEGVPAEAWTYKLGNRSALEWVLDQYKESKPKDPTIAEKFNTYKFADYKDQIIDLLKKVCKVSVETMKIVNQMSKA